MRKRADTQTLSAEIYLDLWKSYLANLNLHFKVEKEGTLDTYYSHCLIKCTLQPFRTYFK